MRSNPVGAVVPVFVDPADPWQPYLIAPALMTLTNAERVVARHAVGTAVDVFRHPTDAAMAVIDPSPPQSLLAYATVCGLGLIAIGVAAAAAPLLYLGVQLFAAR